MSWNPVFAALQQADFGGSELSPHLPRSVEKALSMHLDIFDEGSAYRVFVDVPGVKKENLEVHLLGSEVSISAEVQRDLHAEPGACKLYGERFTGRACRSFTLPESVDVDKAKAHYDGGVLKLTLPKRAANSGHIVVG